MTAKDVFGGTVERGDTLRRIYDGYEFIAVDFIPRSWDCGKVSAISSKNELIDIEECEKV